MGYKKHGSCFEFWVGNLYLMVARRPLPSAIRQGRLPIAVLKYLVKNP